MTIQKGDFVKLNYTGRFDDGRIFDTTDEELAKAEEIYTPQGLYGGDVVIVGAGHAIKGLDEALEGKEVGDKDKIEIPPEKAFGESNPKLVKTFSISKFKDRKAYPGMLVEIDGRKGVVTRVIGRRVSVDFNSPMAGKTVTYEFTIEELIEADIEKIEGLIALYTGLRELKIEIEAGAAKIYVPTGLTFNQRWLMSKNRVATELMKYIDLKEVQFIEKLEAEAEKEAEDKDESSEANAKADATEAEESAKAEN